MTISQFEQILCRIQLCLQTFIVTKYDFNINRNIFVVIFKTCFSGQTHISPSEFHARILHYSQIAKHITHWMRHKYS